MMSNIVRAAILLSSRMQNMQAVNGQKLSIYTLPINFFIKDTKNLEQFLLLLSDFLQTIAIEKEIVFEMNSICNKVKTSRAYAKKLEKIFT